MLVDLTSAVHLAQVEVLLPHNFVHIEAVSFYKSSSQVEVWCHQILAFYSILKNAEFLEEARVN